MDTVDPVQTPPNAASDQGLHCLLTKNFMENAVKMTSTRNPKIRNGLIQMIRMGQATGQKRVEYFEQCVIYPEH